MRVNNRAGAKRAAPIISLVLLALICLLSSCAPGTDLPDGEEGEYSFMYGNIEITPGDDMAPILAALGEPSKYYEAASCAFEGLDKIYTFGSLQINTYPDGEVDRVLTLVLLDDANLTPEGVTIGSDKEAVLAAYGEEYEGGDSSLTYKKGRVELKFLLRDGSVTSVQYRDTAANE